MRRLIALVTTLASFAAPAFAGPCEDALDEVDAAIEYHADWADRGLAISGLVRHQLLVGRHYLEQGWYPSAILSFVMATHASLELFTAAPLNQVTAAAVACRDGHAADSIDDVTLRSALGYHNVSNGFALAGWPANTQFGLLEANPDDACLESGSEVYLRVGNLNYTGNKGWTTDTGYSESWRVTFDGEGCLSPGDDFVLNSNYGGIEYQVNLAPSSAMTSTIIGAVLVVDGLRLVTPDGRVLQKTDSRIRQLNLKHRWSILQADADGDCIRSGDSVYLHREHEFWGYSLPCIFNGSDGRFTLTSDAEGCIAVGDTIELSVGHITLSRAAGFVIE